MSESNTHLPYAIKRFVKDIKDDDDQVQVLGTVKKILGKSKLYIEDHTGRIACEIIPDDSPKLSEGLLVKVFGNIQFDDAGEKIIEIILIQDKTGLDVELYNKTLILMNKELSL